MPWEVPITVDGTEYPVKFDGDSEPTQQEIDEAGEFLTRQHGPSAIGAGARGVARGVLPALAGAGGAALVAAPFTGGSSLLLPAIGSIVGGFGGYMGGEKLQEMAAEKIAPDSIFGSESTRRDLESQPYAEMLGRFLAGGRPSLEGLGKAGRTILTDEGRIAAQKALAEISAKGSVAAARESLPEEVGLLEHTLHTVGNAGAGAGLGVIQGQSPSDIALSTLGMSLFNKGWLHRNPVPDNLPDIHKDIRDVTPPSDETTTPPPPVQPEGTVPAQVETPPAVAGTEELPPADLSQSTKIEPATFQQINQIAQQDVVFARKVQESQRIIEEGKLDPATQATAPAAEQKFHENVAADLVDRHNQITDLEIQHQDEQAKAAEAAAKEAEQLAKQENASKITSTTPVGEQSSGTEGTREVGTAGVEPSNQGEGTPKETPPKDETVAPFPDFLREQTKGKWTEEEYQAAQRYHENGEMDESVFPMGSTKRKILLNRNQDYVEQGMTPEQKAAADEADKTAEARLAKERKSERKFDKQTENKPTEKELGENVKITDEEGYVAPSDDVRLYGGIPLFDPHLISKTAKDAYAIAKDFAGWSREMVSKLGRGIYEHLHKIWTAFREHLTPAEHARLDRGSIGSKSTEEVVQSTKAYQEALKGDKGDDPLEGGGVGLSKREMDALLDASPSEASSDFVRKLSAKKLNGPIVERLLNRAKAIGAPTGILKYMSDLLDWHRLRDQIRSLDASAEPKLRSMLSDKFRSMRRGEDESLTQFRDRIYATEEYKAISEPYEKRRAILDDLLKDVSKRFSGEDSPGYATDLGDLIHILENAGKEYYSGNKGLGGKDQKFLANELFAEYEKTSSSESPESITTSDAAWLARNPESAKKLQAMVDERAKGAGYDIETPLYHGRGTQPEFEGENPHEFQPSDWGYSGPGIYVTQSRDVATHDYAEGGKGTVFKLYAKMEKPFGDGVLTKPEADAINKAMREKFFAAVDVAKEGMTHKRLFEKLGSSAEEGLDEIIRPAGFDGVLVKGGTLGDQMEGVVYNPSQIKSADPITRDDSGRIIPIEERFKPEGEKGDDIRYMDATGLLLASDVLHTMGRQAKDLASFSKSAVERFGEWITPHLKAIWNRIQSGAKAIHSYLKAITIPQEVQEALDNPNTRGAGFSTGGKPEEAQSTKHVMHGEEVEVKSKPVYTPEEAMQSASSVLDDLGIKHDIVDLPASGNREGQTVESFMFDPKTFTDEKATELAERMVKLKSTGNETELGPLIASVTNNLGGHNPELVDKLSENARFRLIQVARSQASGVGRFLGSLGIHSANVNERASDPNVHLINEFQNTLSAGTPEAIDAITRRLADELPKLLSQDEIRDVADKSADITHITQKLAEATEPTKFSRIVRWVNQTLSPKTPSKQKFKEEFAIDREAADAIIEHAKNLGVEEPEPLKNQKLTPEERLARMVTPENMFKIQTAIENAITEVQDKIDSGDPKFAHWKEIEENFLNYSPTTIKLAEDVIKGRFKGTNFKGKEIKPEDLRIDLRKLATSPKDEVERVIKAQMDALEGVMKDGSPETIARIHQMIEGDVRSQLENRRKEYVDKVTKGEDVSYETKGKTPAEIEAAKKVIIAKHEEAVQKLLNANGLIHKQVSELSGKRVLQNIAPSMTDMIKSVMENPATSQAELPQRFSEAMQKKFSIDPALADKFGETLARAYSEKFKAARQRALKESVRKLTPQQREAVGPGTPLYKSLNALANSGGAMESINVLRAAMKDAGYEMPTYEQTKRLQELSQKEQAIRKLTKDDEANGVTAYQKEKATRGDRQPIINQMETLWSQLSKPFNTKTGFGRENLGAALQEGASANMLTTPAFATRQLVDVATQMFYHTWTRALSGALERYKGAKAEGKETTFWKDAASSIGDAYRQRLDSLRAAMADAGSAFKDQSPRSQVMGIKTGIHAFDRLEAQAKKLEGEGKAPQAAILRLMGLAKYSFRYASALDHFQGKLAEHQEKWDYIITKLTEMGDSMADVRKKSDQIMGDMKGEHAEALKVVSKMPEVATKNRDAAAWELVDAKQNERMKDFGLDREDFAAQVDPLIQTIGWNLPEEGGLGGVVGGFIKNLDKTLTKAGVPLPVARFGNAIAIGVNRALTFSGLGLFPRAFGHTGRANEKSSPWFRTAKDRTQRKIEAVSGLAMLGGTMFAMAGNGLLRIYNEWPQDPEDKELWERDGHRPGTMEFNVGNGKVVRVSMTTGPFSVIRPILAAIGSVQDKDAALNKKNLDAKGRAKKGGLVATAKEMDMSDMLAAAMKGGWASIMQGRTTNALLGGGKSRADLDLGGLVSGMVSSSIPFQPMTRTLNNLAGNTVDYKKADLLDLMVPTPWSPQKKNFLGDPAGPGTQSDRIISILTGGTVPRGMSPSENDTKPYAILRRTGYRPPSITPDEVYPINGKLKRLSPEKLDVYTEARGRLFKRSLSSLPYSASKEEVSKAYREANTRALKSVGVTIP